MFTLFVLDNTYRLSGERVVVVMMRSHLPSVGHVWAVLVSLHPPGLPRRCPVRQTSIWPVTSVIWSSLILYLSPPAPPAKAS